MIKRGKKLAFNNDFDFDEPDAIDLDLAYEKILSLKEGKATDIPVYSFVHHNRVPGKAITIYGASVIVLEGIYALYDKRLLDLMDLKIYVDADLDICLARRLSRDIVSRGRELEGSIQQWQKFVKPNAVKYVTPTMKNADAIIPSVNDNRVAVQLLINHITSKLELKSEEHLNKLVRLGYSDSKAIREHDTVHELKRGNQVNAILTLLLDRKLSSDDFIFYFDRIATILLNTVLDSIVPYKSNHTIVTPIGTELCNQIELNLDQIATVNIIRSGDCFMRSLRKTIPNISTGKLLIQSDSQTGEPQLHCEFLPPNIDKNYKLILLTESQLISGAAMIMAIQVLLDHGVQMKNIAVVVLIATEMGVRRIVNAFGGSIKIFVGRIIDRSELKDKRWALKNFIDSEYFGCP